uniref:Uncharacterized protein n=1 Tax=Oryza brachyantha TaxID=4533 RepID=J3LCX8_ORYBR
MASARLLRNVSICTGGRAIQASMPPEPERSSATDIASVFATDTISTFAGLPNPKSTPYTQNLVDPATENERRLVAARLHDALQPPLLLFRIPMDWTIHWDFEEK